MEKCDEKTLWLDYKNITKVVQVGSHVYIDDGLITLTVKEVGEHAHVRLHLHLLPCVTFTLNAVCLQAATT